MRKYIGIAGAGFSGAIIARELAEKGDYKIVVFDERLHIGGNCYTERDSETGIMVHVYGPHIFHTNREDVWNYVNRFAKFYPFTNRVKAVTERGVYSLPINLLTINQFFNKMLNPSEARTFLLSKAEKISKPMNFEEQALSMLGRELYENFFHGYTSKQWGVDPKDLPASILARLPVRFTYDDNYYASRFQGMPMEGYTEIIRAILDHPNIEVRLGSKLTRDMVADFSHTFFSGPLDSFYDYKEGRLRYRTLDFEKFRTDEDFQGNAVVNYCSASVPYTRITEHKYFSPWEEARASIGYKEFSREAGEKDTPYYPVRLESDKATLSKYIELAQYEDRVTFVGRLGTYRYLDMHVVVGEALDTAERFLKHDFKRNQFPSFVSH